MKNVPRPDSKTSRSLRTTTSRTPAASGKPSAAPRPRNAGDDYEQFVNAALRASRQDEARAQRRREQRRKQNIIWIIGFVVVVLALILVVWAITGRRAQNPATDLTATGNATESVVEPAQPVGNGADTGNGVDVGNGVDAGNALGAGPTGGVGTIPVEIQVISDATAASAKVVLLSSDANYKIVGKSNVGTPEPSESGELSLLVAPLDGSTLEVCAGESCTNQTLPDGKNAPELVSLKVAADLPYTLCARSASGAVREVARFRALVKVNRAPQTP